MEGGTVRYRDVERSGQHSTCKANAEHGCRKKRSTGTGGAYMHGKFACGNPATRKYDAFTEQSWRSISYRILEHSLRCPRSCVLGLSRAYARLAIVSRRARLPGNHDE